jgi:branched-chain amino acid transport system permease protein
VSRALLRRSVKAGLLGGMAIVYLSLVGMVQKFDSINIIEDKLTFGRLLILLPPIVAGFFMARARVRGGEVDRLSLRQALTAGLLVGALAGGVTALGIAVVHVFPDGAVRNIFTSVNPLLLTVLAFDQSTGVGAVILLLASAAGGLVGAALNYAPQKARRPVQVGMVVTVLLGMLQNVVRVALTQLGVATDWLYSTRFGGLTYLGTAVMFVAVTAILAVWGTKGAALRDRVQNLPDEGKKPLLGFGAMVLVLILLVLPQLLGSFLSLVLGRVGIFLLMGIGLNIVVGYAGLLDLGYVAFFAVGAYATGVLTAVGNSGSELHPELSYVEALPIVIVIAVVAGLLIGGPVLRLRGDYLALVTLGFGEIARVLVTSDWLRPFLGGAPGLIGIPAPHVGSSTFRDPQPFYYLTLAFCAIALLVSWRLSHSRVGRAWNAMREDEQVAEAMGISTVKYKLLAFGTGAAIGSLSGSLFAVQIGSLSPASFTIFVSITALAIVILGGMGSLPGVVLGALVLIGLPGFLTEFQDYQLLIYGAVLVGIMILRPQGLIPNVRRMHELKEDELAQDQWIKRTGDATVDAAVEVGAGTEAT